MAGEWKDTTLGGFVALQRGHDLTEPERRPGRIPVMGSAGQNGFHDTALAKGPGLVIGRSGASFGQVHFCATDYWPHNTCLYATDFKGNIPRFAFYLLKTLDFGRYNSGSAQPSLNRNFIYPIPIRVPEPPEQEAIASVLGALDDKIEMNRRMNVTLEAMARALFANWFESIRNEIVEHIVQELIREGVLLIGDGYRATASEFGPDGLPFIRAGNLTEDGLDLAGAETLTAASVAAAGQKVGKPGDVAFTSKGTVGRITRVPPKSGAFIYSPQVCFWRSLDANALQPNVLYRWMRTSDFVRQVAAVSAQTDMAPYVSLQDQRRMVIRLPRPVAQREIAQRLAPIDDMIAANAEQSRTLAGLRDTLLPKLLSGELRVQGLE